MPTLKLSDISKSITKVPTDITKEQGATLLTHDLFTNDILYMEVCEWGMGGVWESVEKFMCWLLLMGHS